MCNLYMSVTKYCYMTDSTEHKVMQQNLIVVNILPLNYVYVSNVN